MVLFTPNQWTRLRDEEDFLNLDLSYEKNPEGKVQLLCTLKYQRSDEGLCSKIKSIILILKILVILLISHLG